jgi:hypothetical protein
MGGIYTHAICGLVAQSQRRCTSRQDNYLGNRGDGAAIRAIVHSRVERYIYGTCSLKYTYHWFFYLKIVVDYLGFCVVQCLADIRIVDCACHGKLVRVVLRGARIDLCERILNYFE